MEDYEGAKAIADHTTQEMAQRKTVEELSKEATQRFGDKNASFEECLALLATAQEAAVSEGDHLSAKDATCLGDALVVAGNDLYNGGYDNDGTRRFVEAAEMFTYAIGKDPDTIWNYLELTKIQAHLEWHPGLLDPPRLPEPYPAASQTMAQVEERLQKNPKADTADVRLDMAKCYCQLETPGLAINSLAIATEKSVKDPSSRVRLLEEVRAYFDTEDPEAKIEPIHLENFSRAIRRALIQDPNDRIYTILANFSLWRILVILNDSSESSP